MKKRLFALLTALVLLFGISSLADEFWDEDDDFWDDDEFFDGDDEMEDFGEEDTEQMKGRMDALAGYHDIDYKEDQDFYYIPLDDGQSCVTNRYIGYDTDVAVPEKLGGLTVVAIGENTFQNCTVKQVFLPDTILSIDNCAFFNCESLQRITVPEGVVSLGRCCFGGCVSLEQVQLPESLETVDEFVFLKCLALSEINFGPNLKAIGPNAFCMCAALMKVVLPDTAVVDESAFSQCPEDRETTYIGG